MCWICNLSLYKEYAIWGLFGPLPSHQYTFVMDDDDNDDDDDDDDDDHDDDDDDDVNDDN